MQKSLGDQILINRKKTPKAKRGRGGAGGKYKHLELGRQIDASEENHGTLSSVSGKA